MVHKRCRHFSFKKLFLTKDPRPCRGLRGFIARLMQTGELRRTILEIINFCLPPEGCSYRMALGRIKKACPGHALRVMGDG